MADDDPYAKYVKKQGGDDATDPYAKYTAGTQPATRKSPFGPSTILGETEPTTREDLGTDPVQRAIVDMVVDPLRSIGSDIYAHFTSGGGTDPDKFYEQREKGLKTTDILGPKSATTEAIEAVPAAIGGAIQKGLSAVSDLTLGSERTRQLGPYATTLGDVVPVAAPAAAKLTSALRPSSLIDSLRASRDAARLENQARKRISDRFKGGLYTGGPSALDAIEQLQAARRENQPFTLMDVNNPLTRALSGTTYREGGAGRGIIRDFLDRRKEGAVSRSRDFISRMMGDPNTFSKTYTDLKAERSTNARPIWDEAAKGPGLKVLEGEFTKANMEAGRAVADAQQAVSDANNRLTQLQGRRATVPRDTFGKSSEERLAQTAERTTEARQAEAAVTDAQARLAEAVKRKGEVEQLMRTAQADGTAGRPDATWSPYLEMLRKENPRIKAGLNKGWEIERDKAHGEGKRPNPRDYAIVGFDEAGNPIVGAVPNMKLWMVAKEGLDAQIADEIRAAHGDVSKETHAKIMLRDGLVTELDRLNPRYKPARDAWSGDSASVNALQDGRYMLEHGKSKRFPTDDDLADYLAKLSPSDREIMKLGLAHQLLEEVRGAPLSADKSKRLVNTDIERTRINMLLGPDADRFLEAVRREADMERTRYEDTGNSLTQLRAAEDAREKTFQRYEHLGRALSRFGHNPLGWLHIPSDLMKAVKAGRRPDMQLNESVARILTDPNVVLSDRPGGPILPPMRVPRAYMMTPGRVLAGGELAAPRDTSTTDSLTRALGMQ